MFVMLYGSLVKLIVTSIRLWWLKSTRRELRFRSSSNNFWVHAFSWSYPQGSATVFFLEFIHCENKLESSLSTEKTFVNIFRLTSSYTVKEMVNNCQNAVLTEPADQKILRTCCRGQGQASKWGHLVYEASLDYRISSDPKSVWHQSISENSEILLIQIGTFISILSSLLCR